MRTDTTSDLKTLLEENLKLSKSIFRSTEKIKKMLRWAQVMGIVRLLIILIPIILALLYIPPFLQNIGDAFGKFYGGEQLNILDQFKNIDPSAVEAFIKSNK